MTMEKYKNPYKGPFPFTSGDEDVFFGRKHETEELVNLIKNNQLTVLFGSSGTGKTSLIHAKLLPQLKRQYFHPIYLRINFANEKEDPLVYVQNRIFEELKKWDEAVPLFEPSQTLVDYAAKNVIYRGLIKPVLFFDQFEEIFTIGPQNKNPEKIATLIVQLTDLIELRLPDNLKKQAYVENITNFKVVLSLRQDWVGYLDDYSHLIPSILENRYRLRKFSFNQALEAIVGPANGDVSKQTAEEIIRDIGTRVLLSNLQVNHSNEKNKDVAAMEVDPFVLSLYCYQLYEKANKSSSGSINEEFVFHNHNRELIRAYYEEKMTGYENIKKLIETKLLNESGKRLILPLMSFVDHNKEVLNRVNEITNSTGILRITGMEERSEIEIVHDRLANEIKASRTERHNRELNAEAQRKNDEAEELRTNARKKEEEAESFKQKANSAKRSMFVVASIALAIVSIIFIWAYSKSQAIIQNAKNNYTIEGLQAQVNSKEQTILNFQDSLNKLVAASNTNFTFKPVDDTASKRKIAEYDSTLARYNRQTTELAQVKNENSENVFKVKALGRKYDSVTNLLAIKNLRLSEEDKLQSSNIIVTQFCPYGYMTNEHRYYLRDLEDSIFILEFRIANLAKTKAEDSVTVKITYPIQNQIQPEVYIKNSAVSPLEINVNNSGNHNGLARGTYSYEIFYKKGHREGIFELR